MRFAGFAAVAVVCIASIMLGLARLPLAGPAPLNRGSAASFAPVVGFGVLAVAATAVTLAVARRRRGCEPVERFWLLPYRTDEATPEALDRLQRAFHAGLMPSALRRWTRAAPALGLEVWSASRVGAG